MKFSSLVKGIFGAGILLISTSLWAGMVNDSVDAVGNAAAGTAGVAGNAAKDSAGVAGNATRDAGGVAGDAVQGTGEAVGGVMGQ